MRTKRRKRNMVLVALGFFHESRFLIFSNRLTMNSFTKRRMEMPSMSLVSFPCCFLRRLYFSSSFFLVSLILRRILMQGSCLKKGCSMAVMYLRIRGWM